MGIKLGGNNVYVRCRLYREEEHVCNEKQLDRSGIGHSLPPHIRERQQSGMSYQISKAANKTTVYIANRMEELLEQAKELKVILVHRTLTACGAKGGANVVMTSGASPRTGS